MVLQSDDLTFVRTYVVWTPPADSDLDARFDLLHAELLGDPSYDGTLDEWTLRKMLRVTVAQQFVRTRMQEVLNDPTSFSADDYSESWSGTAVGLQKTLDELTALAVVPGQSAGHSVGRLTRADPYRTTPPPAGPDPYAALRGRGF